MSLRGAYDPNNIFAKILRGEVPAVKLYEDEDCLAFMDVFPQSAGHCLVIAKRSIARNLLEVEPNTLTTLILVVQRLAKAVDRALTPDGLMVTQFNGAPAGQTVFHLHWHVIPRYQDVPLAGHGQAGMADMGELTRLAASIKACL